VLLTFGGEEGAQRWLQEMNPMPFDMLSDARRKVYTSIGLTVSLAKTWNSGSLTYYAEQKAAGRKLPSALAGVTDDPNQMGGDFILDNSGKAVLVHLSKTPSDRPTVPELLTAMR